MNEQKLSYKIAKHLLDGDTSYLEGLSDAVRFLQAKGKGLTGLKEIVENSNQIKGKNEQ